MVTTPKLAQFAFLYKCKHPSLLLTLLFAGNLSPPRTATVLKLNHYY